MKCTQLSQNQQSSLELLRLHNLLDFYMNIFYLHEEPQTCAAYHCNKHVTKMITEHNQMLCTNLYILHGLAKADTDHSMFSSFPRRHADGTQNPYRIVHVNHPCTKWLRESKVHTMWLLLMNAYLCNEYTSRYGKTHAGQEINCWLMQQYSDMRLDKFSSMKWNQPPQAMPEDVKHEDSIVAYRQYYNKYKSSFAKWHNETPSWYEPTFSYASAELTQLQHDFISEPLILA